MGIVSTIPEKCRRCYTCVRDCPAKAIRVEQKGQAMVIDERCIACGNCVKVCAQKAKRIEDSVEPVRRLLASAEPVYACLAPSFPAAFHEISPGKILTGVRALGFRQVWEVAFGAELVSREYAALFQKAKESGARVITTPCPAIVAYVEKYLPSLHVSLAPVVSPMIAVARAIRHRHGPGARVVFVGPCVAKKKEIEDPAVRGDVDAILTFQELSRMFEESGLDLGRLAESRFDGPRACLGGSYPISGGLLRTAGLSSDILQNDIVVTEGKERVLDALRELGANGTRTRLLDVLFCEGCIDGPRMQGDLSVFARKEIVSDYVRRQEKPSPEEFERSLGEFRDLDLSRTFAREHLALGRPSEEEIARALAAMKKSDPADQLNCGACGYPNCREKAVAVCQGLAEAEMCLPYLIEELEATCGQLERSHRDLESAQNRLVQTERLASMGQLSAGVAHEINNPLGTILIYSHMLLKQLGDASAMGPDLKMIVTEATRCKNIVRGLLDFARQSRVSKAPTDLAGVADDVLAVMGRKADNARVRLLKEVPDSLPPMMLDADQMKQMLINLIDNAIDACRGGGEVRVRLRMIRDGREAEVCVIDTGCGISAEILPKLFNPFFTTKEMGEGTGLGLAITYGIVKMHSGDIAIASEPGKGTTVTVTLPVDAP